MKFYFYATILIGLMVLLAAAGYDLPVSGGLMKTAGFLDSGAPDISDFKGTTMWGALILLLAFGTAGIVIGTFGRAPDINLLSASIVSLLAVAITADYIAIMTQLNSFGIEWITWSMGALFTVLMVGFFISIISYWRGTD